MTNLFEFPHGCHVVLKLVQAPERGDPQLCVLNSHLWQIALLHILIVEAFMSVRVKR